MSKHYNFETHITASPFLAKMRARLEGSEARNGLILGLALAVEKNPQAYGDAAPYFATVENGGVVAALMTPPHGVVLYCDPQAVDGVAQVSEGLSCSLWAIAHNLYSDGWPVPSVHGPSIAAERFAEIWSGLVGTQSELDSAQRAFELRKVDHPTYTVGHLRQVTKADHDLAAQWIREFDQEALNEDPDEGQLLKRVSQKIADGHFFFWEDEEPVSLAGITRPTARGISIGPVYTPPKFRGHGYASSAVTRLSQDMLDSGKEFCALFTDLANPTSNSIYQKIGYRPVGDFRMYKFGER